MTHDSKHTQPELSTQERDTLAKLFTTSAPWMIARGGLGIIFGVLAAFWPRVELANAKQLTVGLAAADWLIISFIALNALLLVVHGWVSALLRTPLWGQAVIALPALLFLFIADTPGQVRAGVAVWALLHGALEIWMWRDLRGTPSASDHLVAGGVFVLLAIIVGFGTDFGPLTILGFMSAATLIAGVIYVVGGLHRRSQATLLRARLNTPAAVDPHEDANTDANAG